MGGVGGELEGGDRFVRTLGDAAHDLEHMEETERVAGELLKRQAAAAAPWSTGFLSHSHGFKVDGPELDLIATAPYATIVHSSNPWLTRTVERETAHVADVYLAGLDKALARVKGI